MSIFEKIDVSEIIKRHFATLSNADTKKIHWPEIRFFYIYPIILIFTLVSYYKHTLSKDMADLFIQGFALMGGFLINALVMLMDRRRNYDDSKKYSERVSLIEETYVNTAFGVLVSFIIIIFAGIAVGTTSGKCVSDFCTVGRVTITSLTYYCFVIFLHTLAMVLKRLDRIFRE